jgi:hypothetical protein
MCRLSTPKSHARIQKAHPLHLSSSTMMEPVSLSCSRAFSGHDLTQGASSHFWHAKATFRIGSILTL